MLTAKGSEYDTRPLGWTAARTTIFPKPFRMMELISRIKARLRRVEDKGAEEYRMGESVRVPLPLCCNCKSGTGKPDTERI